MKEEQKQEVLEELHSLLECTQRRKNSDGTFGEHLAFVPRLVCSDGLSLSVQASAYHYCLPRDSVSPWHAVEVGYPSRRVEKLMRWMEDWGGTEPTNAVYAYVPIEILAEIIADAGGLAKDEEAA